LRSALLFSGPVDLGSNSFRSTVVRTGFRGGFWVKFDGISQSSMFRFARENPWNMSSQYL